MKLFHAIFLVVSILLAASVAGWPGAALFAGQSQTASPAAPGTPPRTAVQQFKNIQVLKDIAADDMLPSMQFISASLGVECDFCHVPGAFEKDDKKPKQTARKMMEMTFAINQDQFNGHRAVTCYSCHHGSATPVGTPLLPGETAPAGAPEPAKDSAAPALPPAGQLIDRYLKALGDGAALQRLTSLTGKGTAMLPGNRKLPFDLLAKAPDARLSIMHLPNGESVTAYNGRMGWLSYPGRPSRDMSPSEADGARLEAEAAFPASLKRNFSAFRTDSARKAGEHDSWLVLAQRSGKPDVKLYFDQGSGLLLRMTRYTESPLGFIPTQVDYSDYREQGGLKIPFRWTIARPGGDFTVQMDEFQQNVAVDGSRFDKPVTPAESKPPGH